MKRERQKTSTPRDTVQQYTTFISQIFTVCLTCARHWAIFIAKARGTLVSQSGVKDHRAELNSTAIPGKGKALLSPTMLDVAQEIRGLYKDL